MPVPVPLPAAPPNKEGEEVPLVGAPTFPKSVPEPALEPVFVAPDPKRPPLFAPPGAESKEKRLDMVLGG